MLQSVAVSIWNINASVTYVWDLLRGHIANEVFAIRDCENTGVKYIEHYKLQCLQFTNLTPCKQSS